MLNAQSIITAPTENLADLIPYNLAKQLLIFPVKLTENTLDILHPYPNNILVGDQLRAVIGLDFHVNIIPQDEEYIRKKIDEFYTLKTSELQPINEIIERAILLNASDIHMVASEDAYELLMRIDGELTPQEILETAQAERLISILKLNARLNIAESRKPQSGSFTQEFFNRKIDFRVSSHPTIYGEIINVRILDSQTALLPLAELGFCAEIEDALKQLVQLKQGMIIFTGPTGSGKTTTLYALLNLLRNKNLNIMTIEDPVEYKIPGLRQSEINPYKDLDYAAGIKSILRQDPDVILIGEIRDEETAKMAFRAAITGHLVFTTLHTKDTVGTIQRLRDLNVANDYIANSLTAVVAQRLARRPDKGRTAIAEMLQMNDTLRQLILKQADEKTIKSAPDLHIINKDILHGY